MLSYRVNILSRDPPGGCLETLQRLLKETFPLGDFPVALYVSPTTQHAGSVLTYLGQHI